MLIDWSPRCANLVSVWIRETHAHPMGHRLDQRVSRLCHSTQDPVFLLSWSLHCPLLPPATIQTRVVIKPLQVMIADFARCSLVGGISSWLASGMPTWAHGQWLIPGKFSSQSLLEVTFSPTLSPCWSVSPMLTQAFWRKILPGSLTPAWDTSWVVISTRKFCSHDYHMWHPSWCPVVTKHVSTETGATGCKL